MYIITKSEPNLNNGLISKPILFSLVGDFISSTLGYLINRVGEKNLKTFNEQGGLEKKYVLGGNMENI